MIITKTRGVVLGLVLGGCTLIALPSHVLATPVFINEIHYDNTGTDTGEAVEIAGPGGTDLTGWSLALYNGANSLTYTTTALSGLIPDQSGGFGTVVVNYPTNGIQNGSPDGLALVDNTSTVLQFLSYEGTFIAGDGPANGLTSTDIGVAEGPSTAVGDSLQLRGTGTEYEDFVWSPAAPNTFGAINTEQMFTAEPDLATLVINEIDYDQPGTDVAEFIELLNVSDSPVNLDDFSIVLRNGSNDTTYATIDLPLALLGPGDFFVICGDAANVINCDLDVTPDLNLIQNGAPDAVALFLLDEIIDTVSYEGATTAFTEGTLGAPSDTSDIAFRGISRFPNGADTNFNDLDFIRACITPGTTNISQDSGCLEPTLAVPEPGTVALLGVGAVVLGLRKRRGR